MFRAQSLRYHWKTTILAASSSNRMTLRMMNQKHVNSKSDSHSFIDEVSSAFPNTNKYEKYKSYLPDISDDETAILKGLASSTVDEIGSGVRAIRIGNNATLFDNEIPGSDTIYERSFYPQLVSTIRGTRRRILLIGNPGTGKSVFQFYLLARYLNPSLFKDNVPSPNVIKFGPKTGEAPKVVIRDIPNMWMEVWFLEQQVVHVISHLHADFFLLNCFDPQITIYFFEPGSFTNIEPFQNENMKGISTLATVSSDPNLYKQTKKIASRLDMPMYTEEELLAIGRDMRTRPEFDKELEDLYTDEKIRSRFATFNLSKVIGMIRYVLPLSK